MNFRRLFVLLVVLSLTVSGTALASGAPTSQFGFKGWPYKQATDCDSTQGSVWSSKSCDSQGSATTPAPTAKPEPTAAPTAKPEPTPCPTSDCPVETQAPSVTQPPKATAAPVATPKPTAKVDGNSNGSGGCPLYQGTPTPKPSATTNPTNPPTATPKPTSSTGGDYTTGSASAQEGIAFQLLNQDRANNGRAALALDPVLSSLARMKSTDMYKNKYFAHQSPTLGSAADMLRNNGYSFASVGENIAHHATVTKAQAAFMSSTGHRTNILGSQWTKVGIGVCYDSQGFVYVTQLFVR
ncbi:MAG: CAP domain-containing protein [Candidatus Limiplasma sp.]|nr:CAP domain-containing protein [Candidatus Limiplasma sp.]